jgi:putative heme degradation protein
MHRALARGLNYQEYLADRFEELRRLEPGLGVGGAAEALGVSYRELIEAGCIGTAVPLDATVSDVADLLLRLGPVLATSVGCQATLEVRGSFVASAVVERGRSVHLATREHTIVVQGDAWASVYAIFGSGESSELRGFQVFADDGSLLHEFRLLQGGRGVEAARFAADRATMASPKPRLAPKTDAKARRPIDVEGLRRDWAGMTEPAAVDALMAAHGLERIEVLQLVSPEGAFQIPPESAGGILEELLSRSEWTIVRIGYSGGAVEVRLGQRRTKVLARCMVALAPSLTLRVDIGAIASSWVVRRRVRRGFVAGFEAFAADGRPILEIRDQAATSERRQVLEKLEEKREVHDDPDLLGDSHRAARRVKNGMPPR